MKTFDPIFLSLLGIIVLSVTPEPVNLDLEMQLVYPCFYLSVPGCAGLPQNGSEKMVLLEVWRLEVLTALYFIKINMLEH